MPVNKRLSTPPEKNNEPIRSALKIATLGEQLRGNYYPDYLIYRLIIHTGIPLREVLKLTVNDLLFNQNVTYRKSKSSKNPKSYSVKMPDSLTDEITDYFSDEQDFSQFAFRSKTGKGVMSEGEFSKRLQRASLKCGFEKPGIGPMALRNTYLFNLFQKNPKEALYASSERSMPALAKKFGFNAVKINNKSKVNLEFFDEDSIPKGINKTILELDKIRIDYENNMQSPRKLQSLIKLTIQLNEAIAEYRKSNPK